MWPKKVRKSGGILIYGKNYLKPFIKSLKSCPYYSWLEINKTLFNNHTENIKVCAIFSPLETSNYYLNEIWDEISTDILKFTSINTPFLLLGDMNARTGILSDMSNDVKFYVNSSVPPRHSIYTTRNNCDQIINNNGLKLIDLCKSYDVQIANGRSRGDRWGFHTLQQKMGESTVDMAILSDTMMKIINDFKVLPEPDYSDHCKNNNHH